ncbi:MAG TPA: hypothetical protein VKN18_28490 [Blastocatellia bacterium]|nr:hypothetical protein [Blastocatellia bacterium]
MSIGVMDKVWKESKQKGSLLTLILAIADCCRHDGAGAYPSIGWLARRIRETPRHTKRLLRKLEAAGEIEVEIGGGPHGTNLYSVALLPREEGSDTNVTPEAECRIRGGDASVTPGVTSRVKRGDASVTQSVMIRDRTINKTARGKSSPARARASSAPTKESDPRAKHPAIQAVREIIGRYPSKLVWDDIIAILGEHPNVTRLKECAAAWAKVSTNIGNMSSWLFDWYLNSIPANLQRGQQQNQAAAPRKPVSLSQAEINRGGTGRVVI